MNDPKPSKPRKLRDWTININEQEIYIKPDDTYKGAVVDISTGIVYLPKEDNYGKNLSLCT